MSEPNGKIEALVYDAYGALFDVSSLIEKCDPYFPGKGSALSVPDALVRLKSGIKQAILSNGSPDMLI